jgi:hypothetical protein
VFSKETPDLTPLEIAPSSLWVISTVEIAVRQGGRSYLLLVLPSYPIAGQPNNPEHDEGHWAPPFVAYPVPLEFSPPTTVGSVRRLVKARLDKAQVANDLEQLLYQMGLRDAHLAERQPFLELKVSPRSPSLVKAYFILRHGLIDLDSACLRNLADPEFRRGYVFCPVQQDDVFLSHRFSEVHQRDESWFLGKPLQSNVQYVLSDQDRRAAIEAASIALAPDSFMRSDRGTICVVDLSGYGRALKYALEKMHGFSLSGVDAQDEYRATVSELMYEMLGELGVTQAQVAGDGFIATMPERVFAPNSDAIGRVLSAWRKVVDRIDDLNDAITDSTSRVGSRMVLHYGAYRCGRVAGVRSAVGAFDGSSIVAAARLDQGLRALLAGDARHPNDAKRDHFVAVSEELVQVLGGASPFAAMIARGVVEVSAKEARAPIHLFKMSREVGPEKSE